MTDATTKVPEIFAEGYRGAFVRGGVVKLNLVANRLPIGADEPVLEHVATITIPWPDLVEVVGALNTLVAEVSEKLQDPPKEGQDQ